MPEPNSKDVRDLTKQLYVLSNNVKKLVHVIGILNNNLVEMHRLSEKSEEVGKLVEEESGAEK